MASARTGRGPAPREGHFLQREPRPGNRRVHGPRAVGTGAGTLTSGLTRVRLCLCLCLCVRMYEHAHPCVRMSMHAYMHECGCVGAHVCACVHMYVCLCVCTSVYLCMHVCISVCVHVFVRVCMSVCVCTSACVWPDPWPPRLQPLELPRLVTLLRLRGDGGPSRGRQVSAAVSG